MLHHRTVAEPQQDGDGGGAVVVVGVKLDCQSRELLTWALVKIAQSGDRVIALHVLDPETGQSSMLSLVKAFDSVLSAYQGFCNLKQVDLKLKVCRGSPVRKFLVREAKSYGTASVVVGMKGVHHTIGSSVLVAKYCARKLSRNFSVFAVRNGKIVFKRTETTSVLCVSGGSDSFHFKVDGQDWKKNYVRSLHQPLHNNYNETGDAAMSKLKWTKKTLKSSSSSAKVVIKDQLLSLSSGNANKSMALVPYRSQELPESKPGWALLRRMILQNWKQAERYSVKKASAMQRVLKLPSRQSWAAVYPDKKLNVVDVEKYHFANPEAENDKIGSLRTDTTVQSCTPSCFSSVIINELDSLQEKYSSKCRVFSYQELQLTTSNFLPENLIGQGGSSQVYRGCLPDGKEVAVKIMQPSEDVIKQFISEIDIITTLHHKNIISLLGFCFEEENLVLVYDFLSKGSLEENLHGDRRHEITLSWAVRYEVALGVAGALDYLHNGAAESIIHRDVKSSNILLTDAFGAQLSDFGFALWASSSSYHLDCSDVAGTFGYLAPEYFMHGKMNEKVDVYAFGVVLLELLSGRKPIDNEYPKGQESLVMWAKPILEGEKVLQLLDPSMGSNYDHDQLEKMVLAASLCIRRAPDSRPQIGLVLKILQGDAEVNSWARQQVSTPEDLDALDAEQSPTSIQSFLNLAFQNLEDPSLSASTTDQNVSVEDYLQGRWSRTSSFS
ncbi:hypothetical protein RJ639_036225 [Escallonia herrerae]|uniref:Protein kinase domain-containing protein n=1 Tax=Escallonia herrerae TaxID=1293975 RepID=A0AA88WPS8_9ASTE|nr:hypothetical protein RJ639_036225 [Escallonia herrerae]